jgi:pimeloyl-ACP methyl ester carboxylesterase
MGDLNGVAVRRREGRGPTIVFLPGYASDMAGSKALALDDWAVRAGRAFVRFDYRGCGESAGAFEDFTLEDWRDDALAVIDSVASPVVLVGSSMGGWIMLLAALARPERVAALVGIAAAPDFTDWGFDDAQKALLAADGRIEEPSPYGPPMVTTRGFWEAGQRNLLLGNEIALDVPVRLLQGQRDADVPWQTALTLAERLRSAHVQVTLVKDGDHRLSRPQDIDLLIATIESLP